MPKITEVAPPGKKAEEWIKSNKARFKEQYGDNWEPILYAKAWKMFGKKKKINESELKDFKQKAVRGLYNFDHFEHPDGRFIQVSPHGYGVYRDAEGKHHDFDSIKQLKQMLDKKSEDKPVNEGRQSWKSKELNRQAIEKAEKEAKEKSTSAEKKINEHQDPSEYVNKWEKVGFKIEVEDLPSDGKKFKISNKGIETIVTEPETGTYKTNDGKSFKTFDDAIDHLLKNTFSDIHVTESVDYLKRMAGIPKSEKVKLNECVTPIADTVVFKQPNDLSTMAQKLNQIANSENSPKTIEDHAGVSEHDEMTIRELKIACYTSGKILEMMMQGKSPERWNLSKITLAADYLTTVYTFMSSLEGNEPQYESLTESQLNEIFNRKLSPEEEKIANDIYNMAKSTAKGGKDMSPVLNPDFIHYVNQISNYSKYKDLVTKSWKKGFAAGRS